MKRIYSLFIAAALATILSVSGCSHSGYENPKDYDNLKDNINDLINQNNVNLMIQKQGGSFYKASQYFAVRVIEILKRFSPINNNEIDQETFDHKLSFDGYKVICMNSQTGLFRFEGEDQVYGINSWSGEYWMRCILEEINGEIIYASFEKDVIKQHSNFDVDKNGKPDEVLLYYDGDIRLRVNDSDVPVMLAASKDAISSIVPSNQYVCNLYVKKDPDNNIYQLLVGITYRFTNKYGSTSWLSCYEYKNGSLGKTWSSDDGLRREIKAVGYKDGILTVKINGEQDQKKIVLDDDEKELMQKYKENPDITLISHVIPEYKFCDYDNDGEDELIAYSVVQGMPGLIFGDLYFSIYRFTSGGIALEDSFFGSANKAFETLFFNL